MTIMKNTNKMRQQGTSVRKALSIPSDLAEASYEEAQNQLLSLIREQNKDYSYYWVYPILVVSLWDADEAIKIAAKYKNCDIYISRDYRVDEWSIQQFEYQSKTFCEIYSEGA